MKKSTSDDDVLVSKWFLSSYNNVHALQVSNTVKTILKITSTALLIYGTNCEFLVLEFKIHGVCNMTAL